MADVTIKIITPAESFALMSLAEAKVMLGMAVGDVSLDAQLQLMIDQFSSAVSVTTNRVFAQEEVEETWRDLDSRRLFLSHWPVLNADEDPIIVESPRGTVLDSSCYELEAISGKLSIFSGRQDPVVVTYIGGYLLPDEAPDALKQAAGLLLRQGQSEAARVATSGIKSIQHRESRIMFFDPNAGATKTSTATTATSSAMPSAVLALLSHFTRFET